MDVATGNLDSDPEDEIVTGAGPGGGPHVRVWNVDPTTHNITPGPSFFAYDPGFTGGVNVAVGDVNGDGKDDIVTGAASNGGTHVRVFNANGTLQNHGFFAYPGFTGGVDVAVGNLDGDPVAEIITGAGPGGGPHVKVWNVDAGGNGASPIANGFFAYSATFPGGVRVAAGDLDGDKVDDEIITGAGAGGGPHVKVFDGTSGTGAPRGGGFFAYGPTFSGGVTVDVGNVVGAAGSAADIITGAGPGGGPHVAVFNPAGTKQDEFFAFDAGFSGGVVVAAGDIVIDNNEVSGGEILAGTYRASDLLRARRLNH